MRIWFFILMIYFLGIAVHVIVSIIWHEKTTKTAKDEAVKGLDYVLFGKEISDSEASLVSDYCSTNQVMALNSLLWPVNMIFAAVVYIRIKMHK